MKNTLIVVIILVLLGGGYWWYTQQNTQEGAMTDDVAGGTQLTSDETGMPVLPEDAAGNPVDEMEVMDGEVRVFTVSGKPFSFSPATMSVKKGDTVRIVFKNTEGTHDWVVDEFNARTKILKAGEEETIEFVADKAGSFEYYCSVGQHRAMGMKGTLTVTE